jgi:carbonic anhydrase/acetyltransferase-like protein (isoleucine patch superfamily)
MLLEHEGQGPVVAQSAYVAPTAVVCGNVRVMDDARVLFGAIVTADGGPVSIGRGSIVMENALVRGRAGHAAEIGEHVLIGPHAHVNGAIVEDFAFLATGASVFPGARIGRGAEVRINGVVHVNSSLPAGATVPISWVAVGVPALVYPPDRHDEIWAVQRDLDFIGTVYGVERSDDPAEEMRAISQRYVELFGRHRNDVELR